MQTILDVDYVVIGDITRDVIPSAVRGTVGATYSNGGTATFSALTACALGKRVGVVTQTKSNTDVLHLEAIGVAIQRIASDVTTTFENRYSGDVRTQHLNGFSGEIPSSRIPVQWRNVPIAHIGPIYHECAADCLEAFSPDTYVGVTPQGWFRTVDRDDRILHRRLSETVLAGLHTASAVIISQEDIHHDNTYAAFLAEYCQLLIVTSGWQGGTIYERGVRPWSFPAPKANEVDPTGAGDIFATAFFLMHAGGKSIRDAVRIAACTASRSVTRSGLLGIPSEADTEFCKL